ncbi:MAG: hypothetical protein RLO52_41640 [Sandaracinaceae bacterium]
MPNTPLLALVDQGLRLGTFVGVVVSATLALTFFALVACARGAPE